MSNSENIYSGEYGVRESLLMLKKREEAAITAAINELESSITDQRAECDRLSSESSEKREQIEKEYAIRINSNKKEVDKLKNTIAELEQTQEKLKQELAECSFVAVGKKKTLTEKIEDNDKELAKLNNNLRITENSGEELIQIREKNLGRVDIALNRVKESIKGVTDQIDELSEKLVNNKDIQRMYTELNDFDIHKLLNKEDVFAEYVYSIVLRADNGITFTEIQYKNVVFALIPNERLDNAIDKLRDSDQIEKLLNGDTAYFRARD